MATEATKGSERTQPPDLLPVLRNSGILTERGFTEVRHKVLAGDYPNEPKALADRLIAERILTPYQVRRLLANKPGGMVLGKYVILDRIGAGSMGRVYRAQHQLMGRTVALKLIAPEILSNEKAVSRFYREMRLVGRLDHPNVVRAYDADSSTNVLYIAMEYVQGRSLGQILKAGGVLAPLEVAALAAQAASGLAHAHEQGIVHRDVKPSNLLVAGDGTVKVLDLGLGVLMEGDVDFATADGIAVGTVDYMSPEQATGKRDVDGRSDLYSLGCSMYHLITGRHAFPGDHPIERLGKRIHGKPVPIRSVRADLPSGLVGVIDRLMANDPADRYPTATEASQALLALARPRRSAPRPASPTIEAPPVVAATPPGPAPGPGDTTTDYRSSAGLPGWFRPLAKVVEAHPRASLAGVVLTLAALVASGFGLGRLLG